MNFKRGRKGMKNERHVFKVQIDGLTLARMGKKGARKNSRQKKNWYHREMRRMGKRITLEN